MTIGEITPVTPLAGLSSSGKVQQSAGFHDLLQKAIGKTEASRAAANIATEQFVTGENQDLHSTVLATQQASLDFELLLQVRNKVVQSYQEVMRMQL